MDIQEFVFLGTKAQALPYKCRRIDKKTKDDGRTHMGRFESFKLYDHGREIECGKPRPEDI